MLAAGSEGAIRVSYHGYWGKADAAVGGHHLAVFHCLDVAICATALLGSIAIVAYPTNAQAQGTAAAAEALFQQGRDEMAKGNYESACSKLRQSDELDPALAPNAAWVSITPLGSPVEPLEKMIVASDSRVTGWLPAPQ